MSTRFHNIRKKIFLSRKDLPFYSGYTYHRLLRATLAASVCNGAFVLVSLTLKKTLEANNWYVALYSTLTFSMFLLGPFWQRFLRGRSSRGVLLALGAIAYAPVLFVSIIGKNPGYFIFASVMPVFAAAAFVPIRNSVLAHNLADRERGRVLGYATACGVLLSAVVSLGCSKGLDNYPFAYRIILPVAGIAGFFSYAIYSRIKVRKYAPEEVAQAPGGRREGILATFQKSFRDIFALLKSNPGFRRFERNFFLYGMGFIMCEPVIVIFLKESLDVSYTQAATALFVIPPLMTVLCYPLWGRLIDRFGPIRTAALAYCILIAWALMMVATAIVAGIDDVRQYAMWVLYIGYAIKGMAMSGIDLVWNLGSLEFAKSGPGEKGRPGEVSRFMSVHVFIVGLRGLVAPSLGVGLLVLFGAYVSFGVAAMFFLLSCLLMLRLDLDTRKMLAANDG